MKKLDLLTLDAALCDLLLTCKLGTWRSFLMCWSSKLLCIYPARCRKLLLCEVQQLIFILTASLWFVIPRFVIKLRWYLDHKVAIKFLWTCVVQL